MNTVQLERLLWGIQIICHEAQCMFWTVIRNSFHQKNTKKIKSKPGKKQMQIFKDIIVHYLMICVLTKF